MSTMAAFNRRLHTPQGTLTFYFNKRPKAEGDGYHISVIGEDRKVQSFSMLYRKDKWRLVDPDTCPRWIVEFEDEISKAIEQHKPG